MASIAIDSLINVKDYMGIDRHDYTHDPVFLIWMEEVAGEIEDALGQPVLTVEKTDILDGSGQTVQFMQSGRIISLVTPTGEGTSILDSLQYRDGATESWTNLITSTSLYRLEVNAWSIELLDYDVFPIGQKNIRVNYNCGFSPVPSDLKRVFKEKMAIRLVESPYGGKSRLGMSSVNRSSGSANSGDSFLDMEAKWQKVYDRYKRLV